MVYLSHWRHGHSYNPYVWNENLRLALLMNLWPFGTLPTLLYTWQYYDMVERAANPKGKRSGLWLRASFVAVATLGTFVTSAMRCNYNALNFWYFLPGSGHRNEDLARLYFNLESRMFTFVCIFAGLSCLGSVSLLGGTIFWVRKMTISEDTSGLQANALNLKMVFGHIALLLS
jgi:hypothetical protein